MSVKYHPIPTSLKAKCVYQHGWSDLILFCKKLSTQYETWIDEENLNPVLTAIGWICDYKFEVDDWDAVKHGVKSVDESKDIWFEYPLIGKFEIRTRTTMEPGSSNYSLRVECDKDIKGELDMVTWIAQAYRIKEF